MSRALVAVTLAFGLFLCGGHAALASEALIETTAPLADRSEESVKAAVIQAIDKAVRGASAMGFAWFQLRNAQVIEDEVAVQILATDEDPATVEEIDPGEADAAPGAPADDGDQAEEPGLTVPLAQGPRLHI